MAKRFIGDANSSNRLKGVTDGVAIPAGYVGERVFVQSTGAAIAIGSNTRAITVSGTPMTLSIPTAGVWLISGQANIPWSTAPNGSSFVLSTVSSSTNVFAEIGLAVSGITDVAGVNPDAGSANARLSIIPAVRAIFSGPGTIYLNGYSTATASATGVTAAVMAIRIA